MYLGVLIALLKFLELQVKNCAAEYCEMFENGGGDGGLETMWEQRFWWGGDEDMWATMVGLRQWWSDGKVDGGWAAMWM